MSTGHEPDELSAALLAMSGRLQRKIPPPVSAFSGIVGHEIYPVGNKITDVIKRLARLGTMKIKAFFSESASRSEIVATFLAVLELCRDRKVSVSGENGDYSLMLSDEKEA